MPFLVDGDGVIVWHPDEKLMFKSLVPLEQGRDRGDRRRPALPPRRRSSRSNQPELATAMVGAKQRGNVTYYSNDHAARGDRGLRAGARHRLGGGRVGVARLLRRAARPALPERARERAPRGRDLPAARPPLRALASCARSRSSPPPRTR